MIPSKNDSPYEKILAIGDIKVDNFCGRHNQRANWSLMKILERSNFSWKIKTKKIATGF